MELKNNSILKFAQTKEYVFLKNIGQGGTGKTILVKDKITKYEFIFKKYEPYDENKRDDFFQRFIDEIRIMYPLFHKNIVRIYNYFLYPEHKTGYILMEYIDGVSIDEYLRWEFKSAYEDIFIQLINGFNYLEKNSVLHRDIRNDNFLITNDGDLKIIDFGFGKKIDVQSEEKASIILNWPVTDLPDEIYDRKYDHKTEIFFVGKLFNKILKNNEINNFRYQYIIDKMISLNPNNRIETFSEILEEISKDVTDKYNFTEEEREIYISFADKLISNINKMNNDINLVDDVNEIIKSLDNVIQNSLLERYLQDNSDLISCFVNNSYNYNKSQNIPIVTIKDFYKFIKKLSHQKKEIVIKNIKTRLNSIEIDTDYFDAPF